MPNESDNLKWWLDRELAREITKAFMRTEIWRSRRVWLPVRYTVVAGDPDPNRSALPIDIDDIGVMPRVMGDDPGDASDGSAAEKALREADQRLGLKQMTPRPKIKPAAPRELKPFPARALLGLAEPPILE